MTGSCACARSSTRTFRRSALKRSAKVLTSAMKTETHDEFARDDVNNCKLDPARVREARKAEMEYFQKMRVYKKVPVQECKGVTGKMPIKGRWIDKHKQGEVNTNYRSRLVAKAFKRYTDPDLSRQLSPQTC